MGKVGKVCRFCLIKDDDKNMLAYLDRMKVDLMRANEPSRQMACEMDPLAPRGDLICSHFPRPHQCFFGWLCFALMALLALL